jgi:hypothetical protein
MTNRRTSLMPAEPAGRIPFTRILLGTLAALVAAIVVNVIVYFIGDAAGAFPDDYRFEAFGGSETTMGVGNVIFTTLSYFVFAGIVFAIISRLSARPVRIFWYVAAVALLLSLFQPFTLSDPPGGMIPTLLIMHVLSAVIAVVVMPRVATA